MDKSLQLKKLEHFGIRSFSSRCLSNSFSVRKQNVMHGNASTPMLSVECSVSQGSMFGPFLFIMFISGIVRNSCAANFVICADNSCTFISENNLCSLPERAGKTSPLIFFSFNLEDNVYAYVKSAIKMDFYP